MLLVRMMNINSWTKGSSLLRKPEAISKRSLSDVLDSWRGELTPGFWSDTKKARAKGINNSEARKGHRGGREEKAQRPA